jgi:phospholipase/carboxylesterase
LKKIVTILIAVVFAGNAFSQKVRTDLTYSVHLPANAGPKTPVLILMHGYGSNENDLFDLAKTFDQRFITFSLRAPLALGNGGFSWFEIQRLPENRMKFLYKEAAESRTRIISFIVNACRAYHVDSTQVYLLGFSQGAILSFDIAMTAPGKIAGIVALSGRLLDETANLKPDAKQLSKVKVFIGHGTADNMLSISESEKAYSFLKARQVQNVTFKKYDIPHSINGAELNDIKTWFSVALPAEKAPAKK